MKSQASRTELIRAAVGIARAAGRVLLSYDQKELRISYKGAVNIVTEADRRSEELILHRLERRFPDHRILSEESGEGIVRSSPYRWIVDPLDGTTNFAHGYPCFGVSIGLEKEGEVILGVVYDPVRREMFTAEKGRGARLNGRPIRVSRAARLTESLLMTGFAYDVRESRQNNFNHFANFSLKAQGVRRSGSAAMDLCYVACGRLDGFWEMKLWPWDTAAGMLIVTEAGGRVTDFNGRPFSIYGKEIAASNGRIHDEMIKVLRSKT
jgi:myo-inositol-1(or 4)-monophosphatase